jgi:putative Mg2+ transporter-C (MgtC) family protein
VVRFGRGEVMPEPELRALLAAQGFTIANLHYLLDAEEKFFEYRMVIRSNRASNAGRLRAALEACPSLKDFSISPVGD